MTVELWSLGGSDKKELAQAIDMYTKRLQHYTKFKIETIDNAKVNKSLGKEQILLKEADIILQKLQPKDLLITLDEKGTEINSIIFSEKINTWLHQTNSKIVFLIGGSYGISPQLHDRATFTMALSKLTFPHQLVRLLFVEQLYRAFSILKNEKYHHE